MTKRLVDLDDDTLDAARRVLGTATIKDTINTALTRSVETAGRRKITDEDLKLFAEAARDLGDPEVMRKAWE